METYDRMKPIQELGLKLISVDDNIILVKQTKKMLDDGPAMINLEIETQAIATVKPLEGLPLLVIEDEAMSNALNLIEESKIETESTKLVLIGAYTTGYNKAKETYKFTEEDLRRAMDYASQITNNRLKYIDDYIQSLTKKELWIEVDGCSDCHLNDGYMSSPNCCREVQPKITEGKIKAVWK